MLIVNNISKSYGKQAIFQALNLEVPSGMTLAILGRSGCGKTTLLRSIAGLTAPDAGRIEVAGMDVSGTPAQERGILYLYQEALLFPHLNVFRNIAFGLEVRGVPAAEIHNKVSLYMDELGLGGLGDRMPDQLSGGQKQRVAFGRALILSPAVLLLDEPFGNLDSVTREEMQDLYLRVSGEHNITSIFVTHDVKEALTVGERFGIMVNGNLEIFHDKRSFLEHPGSGATREVAFWKDQFKHESNDK